jgi:acyl-coenzyme A thioesterase PaaI-like protein
LSIEKFNRRQLEARCERLEQAYLDAPCSEYWDPGVRISEGRAEILLPIRPQLLQADGAVHAAVYFTALNDAAALAVRSVVQETPVATVHFAVQVAHPRAADEIVAQGRFLGPSGDQYLAEAVLTDSTGREIARGHGAFAEGRALAGDDGLAADGNR